MDLSVIQKELDLLENFEWTPYRSYTRYHIAFDQLEAEPDMNHAVRQYLIEKCNCCDKDQLPNDKLSFMDLGIEDVYRLFYEWNFDRDAAHKIIRVLKEHGASVYRFCKDYAYISQGSCGDIYRWLHVDDAWYVLWFYLCD